MTTCGPKHREKQQIVLEEFLEAGRPGNWKDITRLLHEAKQNNELVISVKIALSGHHPWERASSCCEPYILIYANDSAISEPESVISTLRGHRHPLARVFAKPESHVRSSLGKHRRKRSANILLPLQNNELPGAEYWYGEKERAEDRKPYKTFQPQLAERAKSKKKQRKNHPQKSQTLQFDEQTLKKARRKQWNEPRYCARRYLKVDFADIGWSEWIISPKSFDAYYCSGECQFPIPKLSHKLSTGVLHCTCRGGWSEKQLEGFALCSVPALPSVPWDSSLGQGFLWSVDASAARREKSFGKLGYKQQLYDLLSLF